MTYTLSDTLYKAYLTDKVTDLPDILCIVHTVKQLQLTIYEGH